jgi:hypothetical protein
MQHLLSVLAWVDCREAAWLLASGKRRLAVSRVLMAIVKLEQARSVVARRQQLIWRRVAAPNRITRCGPKRG